MKTVLNRGYGGLHRRGKLLSTTIFNRQLLVLGNAFPHTKSLVMNNLYVLREHGKLACDAHMYIVQKMADFKKN